MHTTHITFIYSKPALHRLSFLATSDNTQSLDIFSLLFCALLPTVSAARSSLWGLAAFPPACKVGFGPCRSHHWVFLFLSASVSHRPNFLPFSWQFCFIYFNAVLSIMLPNAVIVYINLNFIFYHYISSLFLMGCFFSLVMLWVKLLFPCLHS